MAKTLELVIFMVVLVSGAAAETHNVGGSLEWTVPPGGEADYKTWASKENFKVGDSLVFTWSGMHSVANVTEADFEKCSATDFIRASSPATITLTSTGPHYFLCNVGKHCSLGQKLNITVGTSAAASALPTTALSTLAVIIFSITITFM